MTYQPIEETRSHDGETHRGFRVSGGCLNSRALVERSLPGHFYFSVGNNIHNNQRTQHHQVKSWGHRPGRVVSSFYLWRSAMNILREGTIAVLFLVWFSLVAQADTILLASTKWSDEQIADAIYLAEGGAKTKYPYGIKSVVCHGQEDCRKVCLNTIRNNRRRFAEYGHKKHSSFISFLASRYCPIGAGDDPTGLNKNWIRNVQYFLTKGR